MHQTINGNEAILQMEQAGDYPDILISLKSFSNSTITELYIPITYLAPGISIPNLVNSNFLPKSEATIKFSTDGLAINRHTSSILRSLVMQIHRTDMALFPVFQVLFVILEP